MNIKESLENLNIKMQQKNFLFVTNNIHEIFWDPEKQKIETIIDKISNISISKSIEHQAVFYFKFGKGVRNLLDSNSEFEVKTLGAFKNQIMTNISDEAGTKQHTTYIIDFGDFILDKESKGGEEFSAILEIVACMLTSQIQNPNQITTNKLQSKVIFVMRDAGNIVNYITSKNIEYAEVIIGKPDLQERKTFFSKTASRFLVTNSHKLREENSRDLNEAVGLTDGMSNREILQLARIEHTKEVTFKELYYLSILRQTASAWEQLDVNEIVKFDDFLSKRVFGQNYAITRSSKTLKRTWMGLTGSLQGLNSNKPKGILFFCGPTGVGKTEMAKAITEFVFKNEKKMIRFDMSEFAQEHSDQRLLGAPPGFIGFDGGGELTNKVKDNPNSLLLFDEIEKAHPRILDKFLQILEDGRLTSAKGELINFSETFIIFTSNIGSAKAINASKEQNPEKIRQMFLEAVYTHFEGTDQSKGQLGRPEILNRIGRENIIPFNFIQDKTVKNKVISNKLEKLKSTVKKKHSIDLSFDKYFIDDLIGIIENDNSYKEKDGVRGIIEVTTKLVVDELVDFLIKNKLNGESNDPCQLKMKLQKDQLQFSLL